MNEPQENVSIFKARYNYYKDMLLRRLLNFYGWLLVLSGLICISLQIFHWLRQAEWMSVNSALVFWPLVILPGFDEWYASPESWIGVHKIVSIIIELPYVFGATVVGGIIIDKTDSPREEEKKYLDQLKANKKPHNT